MNSLDRFFARLDVSNYGYVVNKKLTRAVFIVLGLLMLFLGFKFGFVFNWVECPVDAVDGFCENPFYVEPCWLGIDCVDPFIAAGEVVGVKPPVVVKLFPSFAFVVVVVVFVLNHFLYNKNYFRRRKNERSSVKN